MTEESTAAALEAHLRRRLAARIAASRTGDVDRPASRPMKQSYTGSCHCGAVRFEADIDLGEGTTKCNCSICLKSRFWKAVVTPDAFRMLQGEESLSDYRFGSRTVRHRFCRFCGVKPFAQGSLEGLGEFYAVNLACLDDVSDEGLATASIVYQDGRNDAWGAPPAETGYL